MVCERERDCVTSTFDIVISVSTVKPGRGSSSKNLSYNKYLDNEFYDKLESNKW